jgi:hypothetical protein
MDRRAFITSVAGGPRHRTVSCGGAIGAKVDRATVPQSLLLRADEVIQ